MSAEPPHISAKYLLSMLSKSWRLVLALLVLAITGGTVVSKENNSNAPSSTENHSTGYTAPGDPGGAIEAAKPILVGLNAKHLKGNEVSVYEDCNTGLKKGDYAWITNEEDLFVTTIQVRVVSVQGRGDVNTRGCMFLSKEATTVLRIFGKGAGIRQLSLRKHNPTPAKASSSAEKPSDRPYLNVGDVSVSIGPKK